MKYCYLDIETESLSPFKSKLHGVGIAIDEATPQYFAASAIPDWVRAAVANPGLVKVGSNIRGFDLNFLQHQGWEIGGDSCDTSLLSMMYDDTFREHGLKQLTARNFGKEFLSQKSELDMVLGQLKMKHVGLLCALDLQLGNGGPGPYFDLISRYCKEDLAGTRMNFKLQKRQLETQHKAIRATSPGAATPLTYLKTEIIPTESILLGMEKSGVRVDPAVLKDIKETCETLRSELLTQFYETCAPEIAEIQSSLIAEVCAGYVHEKTKAKVRANPQNYAAVFNMNSRDHMGSLIYDKLRCPAALIKRTKTGRSTKQEHLELIASTVAEESKLAITLEVYSEFKKVEKTIGTYVGTEEKGITSLLQIRGDETRLYPNYKQRTSTGRLSVFPIQQLPRSNNNRHATRIKRFFIPSTPDHCFIYSDLSQIELRNAAHLSQDPTLMKGFTDGLDLHSNTAATIFKKDPKDVTKVERQVGKTCNFLLLYGGSAGRLMQQLAVKEKLKFSKEQCEKFRRGFFNSYPQYEAYLESVKKFAETHGYVVAENGRIRRLPDIAFGKYLDHTAKVFFGPLDLREKLLEHPGEKVYGDELYWRGNGRFRHALNAAYNSPNQGLGATIIKRAMAQIVAKGLPLAAQIHDAVIVESLKSEALETAELVNTLMVNAYPLTVPIKSDTKIIQSFDESDLYIPSTPVKKSA